MNAIVPDTTTLIFLSAALLVSLIAWFFVNRASVRATRQIQLLEALLHEQKKQNALLNRIAEAQSEPETHSSEPEQDEDFTRLIPER